MILQAIEEGGNEHRLHRHSGGVDPRRNRIGIAVSTPLTTWSGRRDTSLCHAPLRTGQASRPAPRPKPMSSCSAVIWGSTNVAVSCTMVLLRPPYARNTTVEILIDMDPQDPFDFSLAHSQEQVVAGYTQMTPDFGLRVFIRDFNKVQRPPPPRRGTLSRQPAAPPR